jgi:hypothetical protein
MSARKLLLAQFIAVVILGFYDIYFGNGLGYYSTISWFDIPAHIFGGLWAGFFALWVGRHVGYRLSIVQCVLCAFAIGVGWEIFEYVTHTGGSPFMSYPVDTAKDLFDDVIGGAIAAYFARR